MGYSQLKPAEAAELIRKGSVVAYPTEAVYGLGCDPSNEAAVHKILSLKSRPESAGLILIGASFDQFEGWVSRVPAANLQAALDSWPGPNTCCFHQDQTSRAGLPGRIPRWPFALLPMRPAWPCARHSGDHSCRPAPIQDRRSPRVQRMKSPNISVRRLPALSRERWVVGISAAASATH